MELKTEGAFAITINYGLAIPLFLFFLFFFVSKMNEPLVCHGLADWCESH